MIVKSESPMLIALPVLGDQHPVRRYHCTVQKRIDMYISASFVASFAWSYATDSERRCMIDTENLRDPLMIK